MRRDQSARKRAGRKRVETFEHEMAVSSVEAFFIRRVDAEPLRTGRIETICGLELRGTLDRPVRDVVDALIRVSSGQFAERAQAKAVGVIMDFRPVITVSVTLPETEFDRISMWAFAGQLKYALFRFGSLDRHTAAVFMLAFSNTRSEE